MSTDPIQAKPPLRIVHVITRLINGGADENTVHSCNWAARAGHRVLLLHGRAVHPEITAKIDPRVERIMIFELEHAISPVADARALWALVRRFREFGPNVVHTHTSKAGILGRVAARVVRVPVIIHGVHIVPFINVGFAQRMFYLAAERLVASVTSAFINVSEGMRDICVEARVGTLDRHHVVHSGFEVERFRNAQPADDWRELLRLAPDSERPPVLLMMAALETRKRHLEFLEHFVALVRQFPDVRLVLAGDGPLRAEIASKIGALGIEDNVIFAGFRQDPERLIALADICLLSSMREGLPRVVIQYLAGRRPCVVADLPGLQEVVKHGANGLVVSSSDLAGLVEATVGLLRDAERRAELARGAASTDLSSWDVTLMGQRIDSIYWEYLANRA
jgi:glycosyltransferase involved in cell wall biosynthesis